MKTTFLTLKPNTCLAPAVGRRAPVIIKGLKTLVWHLSRETMKEMSSLKKQTNSNV